MLLGSWWSGRREGGVATASPPNLVALLVADWGQDAKRFQLIENGL
jgi:hypothetical protein